MQHSNVGINVLALLVAIGIGSASGSGDSQGSAPVPNITTIRMAHGYVMELHLDPARAAWAQTGEYSAVVLKRDGAVLKSFTSFLDDRLAFYSLPALNGTEPLLKAVDQDINGDGVPDVVVREYTGGAHCCTIDHLFSLGQDGLRHIELHHGHGDPDLPGGRFIQADDDPALEVRTLEWTFAYWYLPFSASPAPEVILDYRSFEKSLQKEYLLHIKRIKLPTKRWQAMLERARELAKAQPGPMQPGQFSTLLADVLDLVYGGNAHAAREYLAVAFAGRERDKLVFLIEFGIQFSSSSHVADLLRLNKARTIGELLAGDDAGTAALPLGPHYDHPQAEPGDFP